MIRILTLAAFAATLSATAALAEDGLPAEKGIPVVLNGKTHDQVRAEIEAAAHKLCVRGTTYVTYRLDGIATCVRESTYKAWAEAEVKLARMKAPEVLASKN